ncbi:sigma 54-interacting transcriptional regulator [Clostridium sp. WLY-B-L2]|uniref:Sigma 54-interacting transcriptional regulator n=2 Tax=Clostridiaceae TaxID=31979 RepID=A0ABS8N2U0_9CLOT|nr:MULTISPECIES: sigma 54-interacting transcriptional regulator [Clostridium]MCC9294112.1 sigma 54-interacting transcriptional regulator [Clostridium aromativorans]
MCRIDMDSILEYDISSFILQAIFDCCYDGLIITDENLLIKKVNVTAVKILGIKEEAIYTTYLNEILRDDVLKSVVLTGESKFSQDCNFYINGSRIRCVVNLVPVKLRGRIIGLVLAIRDTRKLHRMVNNVVGYKASFTFDDVITRSENVKAIIKLAKRAAKTNCNILIEGKSGTGKEVFAQSIHNYSSRNGGPFVAVNCAAIPRELVESELFGYEKGAFTGASRGGNPGKFELADGGTIFLDEVGELPLDIQSKLLRVLDNLKIVRVGGNYEKPIDVRVIAATNRVLKDEIANKNFRGDLYYRLNVMSIHLLPLKDRKEDIELLAQHFVNRLNIKNPSEPKYIDSSYVEKLNQHGFEGNIRELRNIVERSYYLCEGNMITSRYFMEKSTKSDMKAVDDPSNKVLPLEIVEEKCIRNALKYCSGNAMKASELLKIGKATIYRKINKYGIDLNSYNKK